MHVLIIPSWYKTETEPYSGTFFEEQARMLKKNGFKVGILYPQHNISFLKFLKNPFFDRKQLNDNEIFTIYSITKQIIPTINGYYFNKLFIERYAYQSFMLYCSKNGIPDIIHSHSVFWGGVVANNIFLKTGIPFVHTEHLSSMVNSNEYDRTPFAKYLVEVYRNSKENIFVSSAYEKAIIEKYKLSKSINISNLVSSLFFNQKRQSDVNISTFNILNIGGLIKTKNQIVLIRAVKLLTNLIDCRIKLTIVGTGPMFEELFQEAGSSDDKISVTFINKASRIEIANLMQNHHLLVSTSVFETFGLTLAEAHASGIPVVAYKTMGTDDIMNDYNGIVVTENTPEAFAMAISKIYHQYELYDSAKISNNCYLNFSEETVFNKLNELYKTVLQKHQ